MKKTDIKRVVILALPICMICLIALGWDYLQTDRDRTTAADLMRTGQRIDFQPESWFGFEFVLIYTDKPNEEI